VQGYLLKRYAWMPREGMFLVEWLLYLFIGVFHQKQPAWTCLSTSLQLPQGAVFPRVRFTAVMFEATCVALYTSTFQGVPFLNLKDG